MQVSKRAICLQRKFGVSAEMHGFREGGLGTGEGADAWASDVPAGRLPKAR